MDALELIKNDHDRIRSLIQQIKAKGQQYHNKHLQTLKGELDAHMYVEETVFSQAV